MLFFIPGFLISYLTYPGVICHEYAHQIACRRRGLRVSEVVYFQFGTPAGYVRHAKPRRHSDAFWISTAPFFVNTVFAFAFGALATISYHVPGLRQTVVLLFGWIGLSCGMHAFPSKGDASSLWQLTKRDWRKSLLAFASIPIVILIYVGHYLSYVWLDVIYAVLVFFSGAALVWFVVDLLPA